MHTLNSKGERVPLTHCRRPDDPKKRKSDLPGNLWLIDKAVVLCHGLLKRMGMACSGRRNKLGSLHGPQNEESLNGTHPVLLAALQCNSDVQLPYRLPICEATHDDVNRCSDDCYSSSTTKEIVEAAQAAQDAQAGYACDC